MKKLLPCLLLSATVCLAQSTSSLSGTVTDPSGSVIPGAAVTVTNEETGVSNRQTTTDSGLFSFPALPVGSYSVTVEMKGFRSERKSRNVLVVNTRLTVDMMLEVGAGDDQRRSQRPSTADRERHYRQCRYAESHVDLPLNGRNPMNLLDPLKWP